MESVVPDRDLHTPAECASSETKSHSVKRSLEDDLNDSSPKRIARVSESKNVDEDDILLDSEDEDGAEKGNPSDGIITLQDALTIDEISLDGDELKVKLEGKMVENTSAVEENTTASKDSDKEVEKVLEDSKEGSCKLEEETTTSTVEQIICPESGMLIDRDPSIEISYDDINCEPPEEENPVEMKEEIKIEDDDETDKVQETESKPVEESSKKSAIKTYGATPKRPPSGRSTCCNENCPNVNRGVLVRAPSSALSYFCLQNNKRKVQKICNECLAKSEEFTQKCIEALHANVPLFVYKTEPRSVHTIYLDEDSDEESDEDPEMNQQVKVADLDSVLTALILKLNLADQTKKCKDILEKEMEDLEKEFHTLDSEFNKTSDLVEETRKVYLDIIGPKIKPIIVSHVDIDANGVTNYYSSEAEYKPATKKPVTVKHTDTQVARQTRPSTTADKADVVHILESDTVNRAAKITLSATPQIIPRVMPKIGDKIYGMHKTHLHYWLRGEIMESHLNALHNEFLVKFEPTRRGIPVRDGSKYVEGTQQITKMMTAKHLAYNLPCPFILPVGTRIIARFKDEFKTEVEGHMHYAGIVAEPPKNTNMYRYLLFFDDGDAQYVNQDEVLLVCESSKDVWLDVHPNSSDFIKNYVQKYPERPMVRLQKGSMVTTEWNGKWWVARVVDLDCSLVRMHFETDSWFEWIYRGSTRLSPLFHKQTRQLTSNSKSNVRRHNVSTASRGNNQPTIEYMYGADDWRKKLDGKAPVARKSTCGRLEPQPLVGVLKKSSGPLLSSENRLIEFEGSLQKMKIPVTVPKPREYMDHECNSSCPLPYDENDSRLWQINPLAVPMYLGWEREVSKIPRRTVFYRAPCGRRLRDAEDLIKFLRMTNYELGIDYFCFDFAVDCFSEFRPTRIIKQLKDLTYGRELVKITCVNALDFDHPEYLDYSAERVPGKGVTINTEDDCLLCCDCTDGCENKLKCACWRQTMAGISFTKLKIEEFPTKGYEYRRLHEHIVSGIYECNKKCSCNINTCGNRVAQKPLKWHLQVFKTTSKGWGIRPLYDIPQGAFICIYAGQVLTEEGANEDGRNFGDEYLAELDFIEVNEQVKADYESDVTDIEEEKAEDERFRTLLTTSSSRLVTARRITEDDDSEYEGRKRKLSKFSASPITLLKKKPKRLTTRELFGKDEQCYILDAKSIGNIGRYLNHSCQPNVFVQNVFVDTHDLRFPWVAFFAIRHIRAGTELTWDYNYDIGSVPDKTMYCYCGAAECRGRLL